MARVIGFVDFPQAWDGPAVIEFTLTSEHTNTVRFKARLEERVFDLYAPRFLLPLEEPTPSRILVALGKVAGTVRTIGFRGEPKQPKTCSDVCEFEFDQAMVNSKRYTLMKGGQSYYLYVPNEVFAREEPPSQIFLRVAVPQDETTSG
jgi:hypothetical protein